MDKKGIITKVKELFFEKEELQFIDVKTVDGMILRVEDIQPTYKVQEVTEDGLIDVEDGEYLLDTGVKLIVKDSMISEIVDMEEEVTEEEMETLNEEMESLEEEVEVKAEVIDYVTKQEYDEFVVKVTEEHTTLMSELQMLKDELQMLKEQSTQMSELKQDVQKFLATPSAEPIKTKVDFKSMSLDEKLKQFKR